MKRIHTSSEIIQERPAKKKNRHDWQKKVSLIETEADLQNTCIQYLEAPYINRLCRYFRRVDKEENQLDLGMIPDLLVWVKNQTTGKVKLLVFEFKTPKGGGILTPRQAKFYAWAGDNLPEEHYILNEFYWFKDIIDKELGL